MELSFSVSDFKDALEELEQVQDAADGMGWLISCEIGLYIGHQKFRATFENSGQWTLTPL